MFASRTARALVLAAALAVGWFAGTAHAAAPLTIGYSDWPGWVAWEVAIQKGWFKQEGVDVQFKWFDYAPSLDAFSAGKLDGICVTNGDALGIGEAGKPSTCIVINDYSNGNDMIVARPGIHSVKELKGKKVGVELGLVDHLLLLKALEKNGLTDADITLKGMATTETPQALESKGVDAIAAWQPNSGNALRQVPGSTTIFSSKDLPGLIYDGLYVSRDSLAEHKDEWAKVVKVWFKCVAYIQDPATQEDAVKIMAARDGLTPAQYKAFLSGTKLHDLSMDLAAFQKGDGLNSIYGSSKVVDKFNLDHGVYKSNKLQFNDAYIDPEFVDALKK